MKRDLATKSSSLIGDVGAKLEQLAKGVRRASANARALAAMADNPACQARRVFDAAGIDKSNLAKTVGKAPPAEQSPFAIARGNRFEEDVKENEYKVIVDLLRENNFPVGEVLYRNLRREFPIKPGMAKEAKDKILVLRAQETRKTVIEMAKAAPGALQLIDGGALQWDYGGVMARLEADGIAWRLGGRIHVIEIKSFPIVDGQADPDKVGSAARQAAVYVAALQDLLEKEGLDPDLVSTRILLVCPKNTSLMPTARVVDVERQVRSLRRMVANRASIDEIVDRLEPGANLDPTGLSTEAARKKLDGVLESIGTNYVPGCLGACPLAYHCRDRARTAGDPACLGSDVRASLGVVRTLPRVLELANGNAPKAGEEDVATMLANARRFLKIVA
jgi:hypothetical protein